MSARWRCLDCPSEFDEPSFSEGPKTKDPETGVESVRFKKSRLICPGCFSQHIAPDATLRSNFAGVRQ